MGIKKVANSFLISAALFLLVIPAVLVLVIKWKVPSEEEIRGCLITRLYKVSLCPLNPGYVPLKKISPNLIKAVILTEDSLFWQHRGFDWDSIRKNYEENKKVGFYKRGGSTITQQLAKNMFLTSEKSLTRKAFEALITIKIEKVLTKKEILEKYLNIIEFGKDIYGIQAASQHYFKKNSSELDLVESAFLAMLLPNPKKYSASFYKKELTPFAARRINQIIENLYQFKGINDEEYVSALARLETFFRPRAMPGVGSATEGEGDELTLQELEDSASENSNSESDE
jgi:monofunctional biosynthetic peptidoglycan transglycosylase